MVKPARSVRLHPLLRGFDWGLVGLCVALLASMLAAALHDVCRDWDAWYYHLPFAARVAGLAGPDELVFSPRSQAHFAGFPLFGELLQGLSWRLTGRIEAANLPAFASVPVLALFLRRRFGVRFQLTWLALMAVPLIQIHATSCYVDLLGNTAATVLVLGVFDSYAKQAPPSRGDLVCAAVAAGVAANTKLLLEPVVAVALLALAPSLLKLLRAEASSGRRWLTLAAVGVALLVIFATPLKNLVSYGNPFYPERLSLLGHALPGAEDPYSAAPRWLEHAPGPLRFAASLLELGASPLSSWRRWTVDQWAPADSPGYRMGGFFGAYVVFQLLALVWFAVRERSRTTNSAALGFALLTALTALLPQSHELRYYLFWMMTLVSVNLWLARRCSATEQRTLAVAALLALGVFLRSTHGAYAYPSGIGVQELVQKQVDIPTMQRILPGEKVCARRQPYAFAWAAMFHPPARYQLKLSEDLAGCGDYRPLD